MTTEPPEGGECYCDVEREEGGGEGWDCGVNDGQTEEATSPVRDVWSLVWI